MIEQSYTPVSRSWVRMRCEFLLDCIKENRKQEWERWIGIQQNEKSLRGKLFPQWCSHEVMYPWDNRKDAIKKLKSTTGSGISIHERIFKLTGGIIEEELNKLLKQTNNMKSDVIYLCTEHHVMLEKEWKWRVIRR